MKKMILLLFPFILLMTACPFPSPGGYESLAEPNLGTHDRAADYQLYLDTFIDQGLPGGVLYVKDSDGEWIGASGYAELETETPMKALCGFRIASITKVFVSTAVLMLYQGGDLDLDDPIADYLDAGTLRGIENADRATIRQCLSHTSGIHNYASNFYRNVNVLNERSRFLTVEQALDYSRGQAAYFEPGTGYKYSNTAYCLLGRLIETVSGQSYESFIREKIFVPLNLSGTFFDSENPVPPGTAAGYFDLKEDGSVVNTTWGADLVPAMGMVSNALDLARFAEALEAEELINSATLAEMKTPSAMNPDYGLGLEGFSSSIYHPSSPSTGYVCRGHNGHDAGYRAFLYWYDREDQPEAIDTVLVFLTNGNLGKLEDYNHYSMVDYLLFQPILALDD